MNARFSIPSHLLCVCFAILLVTKPAVGQVSINTDNSQPNPAAMLDVKSTGKGFLPPRMTHSEMNASVDPPDGLVLFCTDCGSGAMTIFMAGAWYTLSVNCLNPASPAEEVHLATQTQIRWRWNPVQNASGYKWNSVDDFGTATVLIGTQCWFAKNLNAGIKVNGSQEQTDKGMIEKYCYGNTEANCDIYGGLYQWGEVMNYTASSSANPSGRQGICPDGWHLPSDAEVCQLETFLDATVNCTGTRWRGTTAGGSLKETGYVHWNSPNTGSSNSSGFTALPGGYRNSNIAFYYLHTHAYYWSSTESSGSNAWHRYLTNLSA